MNLAICDDLKTERERLIPMLREYMASRKLTADIAEFDGGESLLAAFSPRSFDLIFLDVYMGGISGIETAKRLKAVDPACIVVFTTTSREHGAEAFDVEALYYLVKPIVKEKLFAVMDKWRAILCEVQAVAFKCGRAERDVFIRDILYIDVLGRYCTVHTAAEDIQTAMPLSAIEAMLPGDQFVRPIRYCLAALRHIDTVGEDSMTLDHGETVPLTRRERAAIKQRLAAYRLRALRGR